MPSLLVRFDAEDGGLVVRLLGGVDRRPDGAPRVGEAR